MSHAPHSAKWPAQIGPYRILRKLGEGGMGIVLEGVQESISRRVAVKLLRADHARDDDAVQRLFVEARAANIIEHPGLVRVSEVGRLEDGSPYLVMDLLDGESLGARLRGSAKPSLRFTLEIAWQIADVITAAHERGILHRDLKPDNVMLISDAVASAGERVKVLDFGLAKEVRGSGVQTSQSAIMGTPRYMSPEQCRGGGEVDERADVYALGVILYELVAGQPPFDGESGELIGFHLFKEPPLLSSVAREVPIEIERLIHRLLAKDRDERPRMAEVRKELHQLLSDLRYRQESPSRAEKKELQPPLALGQSVPPSQRPAQALTASTRFLIGGLLVTVLGLSLWSGLRRVRSGPETPRAAMPATVPVEPAVRGVAPPALPAAVVASDERAPAPLSPMSTPSLSPPPDVAVAPLVRRPLGLRSTRRGAKRSGAVSSAVTAAGGAASRQSSFDDVD